MDTYTEFFFFFFFFFFYHIEDLTSFAQFFKGAGDRKKKTKIWNKSPYKRLRKVPS
jgi:hypothetical protein